MIATLGAPRRSLVSEIPAVQKRLPDGFEVTGGDEIAPHDSILAGSVKDGPGWQMLPLFPKPWLTGGAHESAVD